MSRTAWIGLLVASALVLTTVPGAAQAQTDARPDADASACVSGYTSPGAVLEHLVGDCPLESQACPQYVATDLGLVNYPFPSRCNGLPACSGDNGQAVVYQEGTRACVAGFSATENCYKGVGAEIQLVPKGDFCYTVTAQTCQTGVVVAVEDHGFPTTGDHRVAACV